jgi:hypothetical protein
VSGKAGCWIPCFGELPSGCLYLPHVNPKNKAYQRAYVAFRERLIRARKDAGLKQSEVNDLVGKPRTFISKCELGERRVDFVELQLLAKIYRKNLSFFITVD